jgi:hypothetical protein
VEGTIDGEGGVAASLLILFLSGGIHGVYAYVGNDPFNNVDPLGLYMYSNCSINLPLWCPGSCLIHRRPVANICWRLTGLARLG